MQIVRGVDWEEMSGWRRLDTSGKVLRSNDLRLKVTRPQRTKTVSKNSFHEPLDAPLAEMGLVFL